MDISKNKLVKLKEKLVFRINMNINKDFNNDLVLPEGKI